MFLFYLIALVIAVFFHHESHALSIVDHDEQLNNYRRSNDGFLPGPDFSIVTNEKLSKLKELADKIQDPKLFNLYQAVQRCVQLARKNDEHVLWKYDNKQEGLVLILKKNLNGILYYG